MKKYLLVSLMILLTFTLVLGACTKPAPTLTPASAPAPAPTPAKEVVLKVSVAIPPGDPMVIGLEKWIKNFNAVATGRYKMELYAGGAIAGVADTLDAVRLGAIEIGHSSVPLYGGHDPGFNVCATPYLFNNYEANYDFIQQIYEWQNKIFEGKFNQKALALWTMGFNEFYTVKKPVKTLADVKGLNIAVTGPLMAKSAQALGGAAVNMDWPDEIPSLQKGVVDAGMATVSGALAFMKYWELIKYYVSSNRAGGELCVTMNLDVFNKMPADLQKAMLSEAKNYQESMNVEMKNFSFVWAIGELQKNGVDVYYLPGDERAKWAATHNQIIEDYWKQMGADAQFLKDAAAKANAKFSYTGS